MSRSAFHCRPPLIYWASEQMLSRALSENNHRGTLLWQGASITSRSPPSLLCHMEGFLQEAAAAVIYALGWVLAFIKARFAQQPHWTRNWRNLSRRIFTHRCEEINREEAGGAAVAVHPHSAPPPPEIHRWTLMKLYIGNLRPDGFHG